MSYMPQPGFTQPGNKARDRRAGLVNKLMQQFQQSHSARGSAGVGTPIRSGSQAAPMLHTQQTGGHNVGIGIRAQLGPGGFSMPTGRDASSFQGQEVAAPTAPGMPMPQAVPMPLPGQISSQGATLTDPTAPGFQDSVTAQPGNIDPGFNISGALPFQDQAGGGPKGNIDPGFNISSPLPTDAIHLGNGTFWSPTSGLINPSSDATAGAAVKGATNTFN